MGTGWIMLIFFIQCQKILRPHNWTQVWLWTQGRVARRSLYWNWMMGHGMGLVEEGGYGHGWRQFYMETPTQTFWPSN